MEDKKYVFNQVPSGCTTGFSILRFNSFLSAFCVMFSPPCHPIIQSKVRHSSASFLHYFRGHNCMLLHTSSVALKPSTSVLSPSISGRIILPETDSGTKFQDPHLHRLQGSVAETPQRLLSSGAHFHPGPWDPD